MRNSRLFSFLLFPAMSFYCMLLQLQHWTHRWLDAYKGCALALQGEEILANNVIIFYIVFSNERMQKTVLGFRCINTTQCMWQIFCVTAIPQFQILHLFFEFQQSRVLSSSLTEESSASDRMPSHYCFRWSLLVRLLNSIFIFPQGN